MTVKAITYAGHSAVFLESSIGKIAIDPWLNGNPLCPEALKNPTDLKLIILTHGHADHASEAASLAKSNGAKVLATYELAMILAKEEDVAVEQLIPMNKGGSKELEGFIFTLTDAKHSSSYDTKDGRTLYAGEPCGVIINDGANVIYHAGDTSLFLDMSLIKDFYSPTIALLPIGDHFTMGPKEAAKAAELLGVKLAIPIHYKTFDLLTGSYQEFAVECDKLGIKSYEIPIGESYNL